MTAKRDRKHAQRGVHGKQQQKKEFYYPELKKIQAKHPRRTVKV